MDQQVRPIDANALKKRAIEMEIFMPYGGDGTTMAVEVDAIESAPTLDYAPIQQWISVEDRLPEMCGMRCLLCGVNEFGQQLAFEGFTGYMKHGKIEFHSTSSLNVDMNVWKVTHWRPLPEPPKEDER